MNDNKLLLLDLGGRLQYGVKMYVDGTFNHGGKVRTLTDIFSDSGLGFDNNGAFYGWNSFVMKPYLRPMSSMKKEELKEFTKFTSLSMHRFICDATNTDHWYNTYEEEDWLNAHHFDYRRLIEKGLAIEAPEGMYN